MPFGDNILAAYLTVKYEGVVRRYICPIDAYPLEDTPRGLHCKNCGWSEYGVPMPYVPRLPDVSQNSNG